MLIKFKTAIFPNSFSKTARIWNNSFIPIFCKDVKCGLL